MTDTDARKRAERIAGEAELEVMAFRSQDPEALDRLNAAMIKLRDDITKELSKPTAYCDICGCSCPCCRDRSQEVTEARALMALLANTSDTMSEAAWRVMAGEFGESFKIADTDASPWAARIRVFLAASDAHLDALKRYRELAQPAKGQHAKRD